MAKNNGFINQVTYYLSKSLIHSYYQISLLYYYLKTRIYDDPETIVPVLWHDTYQVTEIPTSLVYESMKYLTKPYLDQTAQAWADHLVKLLNYSQTEEIHLPSDKDLEKILYNSLMAWYIYDKPGDQSKHLLDMSRWLSDVKLFHDRYDVLKLEIDKESGHMVFYSKYGDVYEANVDGSESQMYKLAKLNFINSAAAFTFIGHSWVHFHFNDIISALHYNTDNKESVLYKLLAPHVRFNLAVNDGVVRTGQIPIDNNDGMVSKYFYTTQPFPALASDFLHINSARVLDYWREDREKGDPDGFYFPPKINHDIPYQHNLEKYYQVIRKFVESIAPYLQPELDQFVENIGKYIRVINTKPEEYKKPIDILTTFIWLTSIVHNADHFTAYHGFRGIPNSSEYNTVIKGVPISPTVTIKDLRECTESTSLEEVADQLYLDRFRNGFDVFTRFHPNPDVDITMNKLDYDFCTIASKEDIELCKAQVKFKADLYNLEQVLITGKDGQTELICPLVEMSQSISY